MKILYSGLLRSPASWARVGRSLLYSLNRLGANAASLRVRGFLYSDDFPLPEGVREVSRDEFFPTSELTFAHPGLYHRLRAPRRVGILVYEADRIPRSWVKPIREELDLLLLPSEFCRQGALKAGVPSHMIRLLPFGVDTKVFKSERKENIVPFTFLSVGAPHKRKGLTELLKAYSRAFSAEDRVQLIIKTTYDPAGQRRNFKWEMNGLEKEIEAAGLKEQGAPELKISTGVIDDGKLAELYSRAHVYVQPSYGEGFGLAPLEAAACGCAIIITGWSATTEIFNKNSALHVKFNPVSGGPYEYDRDSDGIMARPEIKDLANAMRKLWKDTTLLHNLRRQSMNVAAKYTWERSGSQLLEYLNELEKKEPKNRIQR